MPKKWKPGELRNGGQYLPLTVGELRAAISELDEDVQLDFGSALGGRALLFYRFVWRGEKMLQIELSENDTDLAAGPVVIRPAAGHWREHPIATGERIGINRAVDLPWRFCAAGNRHVSRPRLG